jgi:hypothetical protein
MQTDGQSTPVSKGRVWTGRVLSGLAIAFLLFDSVIKLMKLPVVLDSFAKLGYPQTLAVPLGTILLICVILYAIPQTSVLGAIFLTGYLGGAVATHTRMGDPLFSHILFPTYMGLLIWGGLYLRERRLSALVPLRS